MWAHVFSARLEDSSPVRAGVAGMCGIPGLKANVEIGILVLD